MKIKKHIPNILSSSRLLSPIVLIPLILSGNLLASLIALTLFFTTDALDGFLARKWQVQSDLGAKIDAVADKLMLGSLLVPLAISNPLMIATLSLEGLISGVNVSRKLKGGKPKTKQIGRMKMIVLSLFVIFCYLSKLVSIPDIFFNLFFGITSLMQLGTLSTYLNEASSEKNKPVFVNEETKTELENNKDLIKENSLTNKKNISSETLLKDKEELLKLKEELINLSSFDTSEKLDFDNKPKVKKLGKKD